MSSDQHFINPALQDLARERISAFAKRAFVPGTDPAMAGGGMDPMAGGGGGMPPMDPMAGGGGMPPMDPMAGGGGMPPMDPMAMGGGMPPMPPEGGGGSDPESIRAIIKEELAASGLTGGGAAGAGPAGGIKPKIDVNVELMQIKKMLAKVIDAMGISIPAADMVATPEDLNQMAGGGAGAEGDPSQSPSPIQPIQPMDPMGAAMPPDPSKGASDEIYKDNGVAFDSQGLVATGNKAAAVARIIATRRGNRR